MGSSFIRRVAALCLGMSAHSLPRVEYLRSQPWFVDEFSPISQMSWPWASIRTKSACSAALGADVIKGERCYRTRNLRATGWALLIPHPVPSCCFLSDPWALVNTPGSRPHPKPGAIKMNNDRLSLFSLLQTSQPKWGSREVLRTSSKPET